MKYVKVMDGLKSNAGGFDYKINDINIAKTWNPLINDPKKMGGFNFCTEDKILRWLHRGDTIYDVELPKDAEVVCCNEEKGVFRTNKIIVSNPRSIDDEMVLELYKCCSLSDEILAECLQTLIWRNRLSISKLIVKDRVNKNNVDKFIEVFGNYATDGSFKYENLSTESKEIYDALINIKNSDDK